MLNEDFILRGPTTNFNIPEGCSIGKYIIDCIRKRNSNEIFCIDGITGNSVTCGEIVDQTLKTVMILRELGVESGDVIGIISENCINYCIPLFASYYLGAAANLLNPIYTAGELKRILNITKPKVIFSSKSAYKTLCILKNEGLIINKILLLEEVPVDENVNTTGTSMLNDHLESTTLCKEKIITTEFDAKNQILLILLSSGTTGFPKCTMITHENFRCCSGVFGDPNMFGIKPSDSTIAVLPFFHVYGLSATTVAALYSLKLVVLPSFQSETYLRCIETYKITLLYAVPSIVSLLTKHPLVKTCNLSSLKYIISGGSCLEAGAQKKFSKVHPNVSIIQMYGLTEFSGVAVLQKDLSRPKSVGKPIPDAEIMIWSKSLCANVSVLETGELCLRGPTLIKGYIDENNNDIDKYGFYHTGDLAYYDEDGYFYIVGRIKELIKYKGYQVAPAEVENILLQHKSVAECAVIGIPNEKSGEVSTAFVVRVPEAEVTEKEIVDFVAERISAHKHLHGGVKFVGSIPKNAAGKILRYKLLEVYSTINL